MEKPPSGTASPTATTPPGTPPMDKMEKPPSGTASPAATTPPRTPRSKAHSAFVVPNETPRRARDPAPAGVEQTQLREDIATAMTQEFVYCTSEVFIEHYLPKVGDDLKDKVITSLKGHPAHLKKSTPTGSKLVFTEFQEKPSTTGRSEAVAYRHISLIGEAIKTVVNKQARSIASKKSELAGPLPSRLHVYDCPNRWLSSPVAGCNFKIDACILDGVDHSDGNGDKLESHRVFVPFEFKLSTNESEVKQNRRQLLAACNQIMNGDPRRDFMYGITIEDDRVSLWYFSRNHSAKASSFSLIKHPERFIGVMISLLSASNENLGFNPNIVLYPKKYHDPGYIYRFPGDSAGSSRFFKTTSIVEECRSKRLSGRTTRVWKAVEVANFEGAELVPKVTPKEVIIKDVWIDASADTEKEIQEKVFDSIDKFVEDPEPWRNHPCLAQLKPSHFDAFETLVENKKYRERFLQIREGFQGPRSKSVGEKAWTSTSIFVPARAEPVTVSPTKTQRNQSKYQSTEQSRTKRVEQGPVQFKARAVIHTEFAPKRRCFFMFDDVCTRVSHVPVLGDAVDIIHQASIVLILMFCAGWIHRDISTGNLLAIAENGEGWVLKLADLEYAKAFPPTTQRARGNWKTVRNILFMATELQTDVSQYVKPPQPFSDLAALYTSGDYRTNAVSQEMEDIVHNLQHDLESLWWIGFYLGAIRTGRQASIDWCKDSHIFQDHLDKEPASHRHRLMINSDKKFPQTLLKSFHPDLEEFMDSWSTLQRILHRFYSIRSPAEVTDKSTYAHICGFFIDIFASLERFRDKWGPIPITSGGGESKKRAREDDEVFDDKGVPSGVDQPEDSDAGHSLKRPRVATSTQLQDDEEGGELRDVLKKPSPSRGEPSSTKSRRSGK
ncbi:hypothetical protein DFP72DRAFT_1009374 [Ephemerocybe angulata]|uniref:Fungal-type protein kinase domain-containing protein n=1 Tax=Ephemerocybe angulata TaxID=980116 RepID=A0A8H6HXL4_9AGAR|nr:hypothetical protein DFP72DRAFT_1009374 [Tulosesus angulatus]